MKEMWCELRVLNDEIRCGLMELNVKTEAESEWKWLGNGDLKRKWENKSLEEGD